MKDLKETELVQLARQGDQDAFCTLYGLYKDRYFRYAYYRLHDATDAEDAVADAVTAMWQQIPGLKAPGAFGTWSFRILSGCCAKLIRQQIQARGQSSVEALSEAGVQIPGDPGDDAAAGTMDLRLILEQTLATLAEDERELVLLSVVGGLNSNEISEVTGLTPGGVRSKLSRSLKKMRTQLEG